MVQFDCPILAGTATVKIIRAESVIEPGPEAVPCRPAPAIATVRIGRSTVDCKDKLDCGITDATTGVTDWERCPAHVAMRDRDSLQSLPGARVID